MIRTIWEALFVTERPIDTPLVCSLNRMAVVASTQGWALDEGPDVACRF